MLSCDTGTKAIGNANSSSGISSLEMDQREQKEKALQVRIVGKGIPGISYTFCHFSVVYTGRFVCNPACFHVRSNENSQERLEKKSFLVAGSMRKFVNAYCMAKQAMEAAVREDDRAKVGKVYVR